ncbi:hypothetical protein [Natronobeatus ordinarius]|uniref:hypothetical protein n=1 Tax=Natronobeatus ordinarius TaxID=2963433 RepID=UPI0020CF0F3E|nr:hypothetical protein [Natronobeatus ordinarius]
MTVAERIAAYLDAIERWFGERFGGTWVDEWARGLYHGMISHPAYEKIEIEAEDTEDAFLIACFPDAFGVPSPVSYYTAELLPYLQQEFAAWERRMWDRQSVFEAKGRMHHHI